MHRKVVRGRVVTRGEVVPRSTRIGPLSTGPVARCRVSFDLSGFLLALLGVLGTLLVSAQPVRADEAGSPPVLRAVFDQASESLFVLKAGSDSPLLTQVARGNFRPYLHPIVAPDGKGVLTEARPDHHRHQTGLFWGLTRVNGRDFFHNPDADHWRRVSVSVLQPEATSQSDAVQWQVVYDLLDESGNPILRDSQIWSLKLDGDRYQLDLQWSGDARVDVTIDRYDYGGLFLRMPWRKGIEGRVVNSARQTNERAEGQRAVWVDVGMQVESRDDLAHIAIFDHPSNPGYPQPWRVDGQWGVGPVRARLGEWKIPAGSSTGFRHRLLIYTDDLSDVELTEHWSAFSGQSSTSVQWNLARQEGRGAKFLTPEAAVAEMTLQDGFAVNVFAAEPMITQPMAFCWDDRGRMWVAENRDYENRVTGFSGSGDSRILILEDTNRDGIADKRTVFAEGIPFPAAMAVGFGGLWLGAPPNLLFLPDRDGDDRADLDQAEVRLTGWGIRDRHETLNSFHWGPDGWLYGLQGYATPSNVGKPAGKGRIYRPGEPFPEKIEMDGPTHPINGGVWRYHPTKDRFEVVAHGFSNPWGIDYDEHGQLFITACVIPHLWHVVPGGIYHRQGGTHFNPHVYNDIKTIADHSHRSAHGGARIYMSDAFPERYHGQIFMANIHEHAVLTDILRPRGSGFVGLHGEDFLLANNAQWVGFSVEIGPEGGVYILDWHDADICGSDVLHKETGRIFRITPEHSGAADFAHRYEDLGTLSDRQLVEMQQVASAWHHRRARLILQQRAIERGIDEDAVSRLRELVLGTNETPLRLRAMWALHVTGQLTDRDLAAALEDEAEYIRGWSIQLLCEDGPPDSQTLLRFAALAASDPSPVVRLYLAAALQRLDAVERWPLLEGLVGHTADASDHNLPKMIWFAMEPLVADAPADSLRLARESEIPMLTRHIARRLSDAGERQMVTESVLESADGSPAKTLQLLLGVRDSLEGRFDVKPPEVWPKMMAAAESLDPESQQIVLQLSQQFGDRAASDAMLQRLGDESAEIGIRGDAIRGLAGQRHPRLPSEIVPLLDHPELRTEAIRATASYDDVRLTEQLLRRYDEFDREQRLEVVLALASRSRSGWELTRAIGRGDVPRGDIPAYVARSLQRVVGNGFLEVWGPIESLEADREALFAKYREVLKPNTLATADLNHGKELFRKTCQACHQLHGDGGQVGPDITGANRSNLEYLLSNILTPSAEIQDAYRMQIVLTDDGRVYSGIPAEENERQLRLRVANQEQPITIAKSQIESRQVASVSMMPDGLLAELSDRDVVDLFGYLQTMSKPAADSAEQHDHEHP